MRRTYTNKTVPARSSPFPRQEKNAAGAGELVSVIMPAYNAEKTIAAAIASVVGQTYPRWELIVINDGSTDRTASVLQALAGQENRINILSTPNSGAAAARNCGIAAANGSWIAFLDSDDAWEPRKLEIQMDALRRDRTIDLIFTASAFMDEEGRRLSYCLPVPREITYRKLLKQNVISCSSVIVRKELAVRYPMKGGDIHEDYALWLSLLRDGCKAYGINEPLFIYRLSPRSKSGNKRKAAFMTCRTYRAVGLSLPETAYYFCWYAWRGMRKYRALKRLKGNTAWTKSLC